MDEEKLAAAEQAMAAFKSGDAQALSDALSAHYAACAHGESEPDGDEGASKPSSALVLELGGGKGKK